MDVLAKNFNEGRVVYDKMFNYLRDSGWRPYTPDETWDKPGRATRARKLKKSA
jgi:hypothetical protein